jgi:hypothetical protein
VGTTFPNRAALAAAGVHRFLGVVEVDGGLFYSSLAEARHDMLNKVRNETARLGGNAFTTTDVVVKRGFSLPFAQADAYACS